MPVVPSLLPRLVQSFFREHLIARRDLSRHTVRAYRDAIRSCLVFVAASASRDVASLQLDDLHRDALFAFLEHLESSRGNSASTRNARLAAIRSFFRYVASVEPDHAFLCHQILSIPAKKTPTRIVTCLDRDEIEHILGSTDRGTAKGRGEAALLQFLYNTGARAQEVADLDLAALRIEHPAQVLILGKGRKERLNPLWPETVELLRDTFRDRRVQPGNDAPLFVNARRKRLTRFGIRHIVSKVVAGARATRPSLAKRKISPHTFRHTTALHLLQAGVELNVVRCWLGHASIETTHAYVEIDMEMKRAALSRCSAPLTGGKPSWIEPNILAWLEAL